MLIDRINETVRARAGNLSRRAFIKVGAAAGGGLLLSVSLPAFSSEAAAATDVFAPDAFIRIDGTGKVTMVMPQVEMGQGTYTSIPMLIAEELEVELATVQLEHAPPNDKLYANPLIGFQATGGSTSVRGFWEPLRRAGATARTMLISAAADQWGVAAGDCRAEKGVVIHAASGRKLVSNGMPWIALRAAALFSPMMREIVKMSYLWRTPHGLSGEKLERAVGKLPATDPIDAMRQAIADLKLDDTNKMAT